MNEKPHFPLIFTEVVEIFLGNNNLTIEFLQMRLAEQGMEIILGNRLRGGPPVKLAILESE